MAIPSYDSQAPLKIEEIEVRAEENISQREKRDRVIFVFGTLFFIILLSLVGYFGYLFFNHLF